MRTLILFAALVSSSLAAASEPVVGRWTHGTSVLSVQASGRYDWKMGERVTDGAWHASGALVSLESEAGPITYAYAVEGDRLTLVDTSGGRIVLDRARR